MTGWVVHPVDPGVVAHVTRAMPILPPSLEAQVSAIWAEACAGHTLFNGRVFSVDHVTPGRITGHWSEYRRIVAQMRDGTMLGRVGMRNLAVCGIICGPGGVLLGRRAPGALYQPGMWQMAPAGSVDGGADIPGGADLRHALMLELHEELGLGPDDVQDLRPLCLVEHPGTGVIDLGVAMTTRLTHDELLAAHRACGNAEYDALISAPPDRVCEIALSMGGEIGPPVHCFLAALQKAALGASSPFQPLRPTVHPPAAISASPVGRPQRRARPPQR